MPTAAPQELVIHRQNIHQFRIAQSQELTKTLADGEVRLVIDRFGLSANNITYAAMGEMMSYWEIYPTTAETARIPVWGFATIAESHCPDLAVGESVFGLLPAASHVVLRVGTVKPGWFMEDSPHRADLSPFYNQYFRTRDESGFNLLSTDHQVVLRPLLGTSYLIDDFLAENDFYGANTILISSASSKTAIGTACFLDQHRHNRSDYRLIGLTSTQHIPFVESIGCYDQVVTYDRINDIDSAEKMVYVDLSGNIRVRKAIHARFEKQLRYNCWVGITHWNKLGLGIELPGPQPILFSAPQEIQKRVQKRGEENFSNQLLMASQPIYQRLQPHFAIQHVKGSDDIIDAYQQMIQGHSEPQTGYVLTF